MSGATVSESTISLEEGYEITKKYVEYFWYTNKFYSLKNVYELEDITQELFCKFLEKGLFAITPKITSKKYHINSVKK